MPIIGLWEARSQREFDLAGGFSGSLVGLGASQGG